MLKLRNPSATLAEINRELESEENLANSAIHEAETDPENPYQDGLFDVFRRQVKALKFRYARGDSAADIGTYFMDDMLPKIRRAQELSHKFYPDQKLRLSSSEHDAYLFLFALVCFDTDGHELQEIERWMDTSAGPVLFDILLRAFVPSHSYARKYKRDPFSDAFDVPVLKAIVVDDTHRASALGTFITKWPQIMKPYGYHDQPSEQRHTFDDFSLNAGLAVCAYDIDDSAFHDQLYYPRDLVDYYRAQIRHRRDSWRAIGAGAGAEIPAAPQLASKKTYALTPADAYARWLELVCDEDPDQIKMARKVLGRRKTMPELFAVMEALSGAGLGTQADMKDDASLAQQVFQLCSARGLPPFPLPNEPSEGPSRISAIFSGLLRWLDERSQRLVVFDDDGDTWQAVFVTAAGERQFLDLCEQLSIEVMDEASWS